MKEPNTKCFGDLLEFTQYQFFSNAPTKTRYTEQLRQGMNPCFNKCLEWDEQLVWEYKNSDTFCCELEMHEEVTFCNYYFQGTRKQPVFVTQEERETTNIRTRAVTFPHIQYPLKDQDLEAIIKNLTLKGLSLTGLDNEIYLWWFATAWSGVPFIFLNDHGLSITTSTG